MEKNTPDISAVVKASQLPEKYELPTLAQLIEGNSEMMGRMEALNAILSAAPPEKWIKEHPYIKGWKYLPIDKVEYLLTRIFKEYDIEVLREGALFNSVYVTVRVKYLCPATGRFRQTDGVGACQLQTKKDTSAADLMNINNGAVAMALPIAKSLAVKDATDMLGNIFGANLNRRDVAPFKPDTELIDKFKNGEKFNAALS